MQINDVAADASIIFNPETLLVAVFDYYYFVRIAVLKKDFLVQDTNV